MTKFFRLLLMGSLFFTVLSCSDDYQGPLPYPTLIQAAQDRLEYSLTFAYRVKSKLLNGPIFGEAYS